MKVCPSQFQTEQYQSTSTNFILGFFLQNTFGVNSDYKDRFLYRLNRSYSRWDIEPLCENEIIEQYMKSNYIIKFPLTFLWLQFIFNAYNAADIYTLDFRTLLFLFSFHSILYIIMVPFVRILTAGCDMFAKWSVKFEPIIDSAWVCHTKTDIKVNI